MYAGINFGIKKLNQPPMFLIQGLRPLNPKINEKKMDGVQVDCIEVISDGILIACNKLMLFASLKSYPPFARLYRQLPFRSGQYQIDRLLLVRYRSGE